MTKKTKTTIYVLILIGVCTGTYVLYQLFKPHPSAKNGIQITALNLAKEYSANEKAADAKYLNKAIEVSGTVTEIDKNQDGGMMIILQTGDPMTGIQCAMRDKGATSVKGNNVIIEGFCSGNGITGVSLTDCIIK